MTRTLTATDYDRIPTPGSLTIKLHDGLALQNARARAYQLALSRGDRIRVESRAADLKMTITKLGKR